MKYTFGVGISGVHKKLFTDNDGHLKQSVWLGQPIEFIGDTDCCHSLSLGQHDIGFIGY